MTQAITRGVKLTLWGDLPCKKNQIRAGRGGGHYPPKVKETLQNLTLQARVQWGCRAPIRHPNIEVRIFVKNPRKDSDGIWTTCVDCLKKAHVIVDDSIAEFNGREVRHPSEIVDDIRDERIEIVIETNEGTK